jgi:hypothetical protein
MNCIGGVSNPQIFKSKHHLHICNLKSAHFFPIFALNKVLYFFSAEWFPVFKASGLIRNRV